MESITIYTKLFTLSKNLFKGSIFEVYQTSFERLFTCSFSDFVLHLSYEGLFPCSFSGFVLHLSFEGLFPCSFLILSFISLLKDFFLVLFLGLSFISPLKDFFLILFQNVVVRWSVLWTSNKTSFTYDTVHRDYLGGKKLSVGEFLNAQFNCRLISFPKFQTRLLNLNVLYNDLLQVDDNTYADIMKSVAVPDFLIPFLLEIQIGIREGTLEVESNDFEKLLGRSATPISDGLTQIVKGIS
ncbi:hypothetical protein [Alkalihalobacterium alkalinitrilicum]|uniref:hypothetical protein n=1 Tax=Alkalihalobacterium alkalinitrilicum TaxID=427920 RepID=UPI001EE43122|nr:hypothetical protein [Alkalihalobacterium alkalinitrilicum]